MIMKIGVEIISWIHLSSNILFIIPDSIPYFQKRSHQGHLYWSSELPRSTYWDYWLIYNLVVVSEFLSLVSTLDCCPYDIKKTLLKREKSRGKDGLCLVLTWKKPFIQNENNIYRVNKRISCRFINKRYIGKKKFTETTLKKRYSL